MVLEYKRVKARRIKDFGYLFKHQVQLENEVGKMIDVSDITLDNAIA